MQYDPNAENRGECNWISECEVLEAVGHMDPDERETWLERIGGHSEREFFRILFQLRDKASSQQ